MEVRMNYGIAKLLTILCLLAFLSCQNNNPVETDSPATWSQVNTGLLDSYNNPIDVIALFADGTNLFAGTDIGVYLSTNYGDNWHSVNDGIKIDYIRCFTINDSNLFAGGDSGVFLSTNNGSSWTSVTNDLPCIGVNALTSIGSNILAGTNQGVFRSTDNGQNWSDANNGMNHSPQIYTFQIIGNQVIAGAYGGAYLSNDAGVSWSPIDSGFSGNYINVHTFAFDGTNVFAGLYTKGVYVSTDTGAHWSSVSNGLTNLGVATLIAYDSQIYCGTGGGVFLSTNSGLTWTSINLTEPTGGVQALAVNGQYLFAGTVGINGGVWRYPL
jgi:photosystem II stability/assembly factor-like uncharacterized protein